MAASNGVTDTGPMTIVWSSRPRRERPEEQGRAGRRRGREREPHLLVGPGDRVPYGDDDCDQGQRDHEHEERQVPEPLPGHGQVAEDAGEGDEAEDRHDPAERTAHEQQQHQRADRIGRHPLRREREAEQHTDHRHRQPERRPAAPPAGPDGGEDRVGRDDEQPDVDVVHADARLDEQHPLGHDQRGDRDRDAPTPEQDPCQQVQAGGHEHPGEHAGQAPGEGVRSDIDDGGRPVTVEHQQLLAILGLVLGLDVHRPRRRVEPVGQQRVGVDRVPVRLDDVDGPPVGHRGGPRCPGRQAHDVDLLARGVERHPRAEARQRFVAAVDRSGRRVVAADHDHVVGRRLGRAAGDVQPRVVDAGDQGQPVRAALQRQRRRRVAVRRIDERDALRCGDRDARPLDDLHPRQATVGDGLLDRRPHLAGARAAEQDLGAGSGGGDARLVVERVATDQLDQHARHGHRIGDGRRVALEDRCRFPRSRARRCPRTRRCRGSRRSIRRSRSRRGRRRR